ncbi:hypothetical protein V2I01_05005 [Micromonospora sp. BRA006-A]|nr:hypothetical protein [Micromonospora sp. BRA006-A]
MTRDERIDAWVAKTLNTLPRTTDEQRAAVVRILAARSGPSPPARPRRATVRQAA